MSLKVGLVGLPNVGKSTLFNALTRSSVPAENFPFCTIDPHIAITKVPDKRNEILKELFKSEKIIPGVIEFVDIAGLVAGASRGEGLGNKFLGNILEVDLIVHVLRCFEDSSIIHVANVVNPVGDFETIMTELMLKDIDSATKRREKIEGLLKNARAKKAMIEVEMLEKEIYFTTKILELLNRQDEKEVKILVEEAKKQQCKLVQLLCAKPYIIAANLSENEILEDELEKNTHYQMLIKRFGKEKIVPVSAKIESELAQLDDVEQEEMRKSFGIEERGMHELISRAYSSLGLISFFTCGPKEIHVWPITQETVITRAAREIHTDLERGFIAADVYNFTDIVSFKSEAGLKQVGKLRNEGRDYIVKDGDIINIKFNV